MNPAFISTGVVYFSKQRSNPITSSSFIPANRLCTTTTCTLPKHPQRLTYRLTRTFTPRASSSSTPASSSSSISSNENQSTTSDTRLLWFSRMSIFTGMSLTYAFYVFLRSTFTYVAPTMARTLSLTLPQIGKITSAFPLAYGASRLITGVFVDRAKPHHALCIGLLLAGCVNAIMGTLHTTSVPLLSLLWALNGLVQGAGAGASAKMLTSWFPSNIRGKFWALWSTSANIGAFLAPIVTARLVATASMNVGYRAGLIIPGVTAALWACVMFLLLKSNPRDAGFSSLSDIENDKNDGKAKNNKNENNNDNVGITTSTNNEDTMSWKQIFIEKVIKNKTIWSLAASYFFVYLIRSGTKSWLHFWMTEQCMNCSASEAVYRSSGMEIGGIFGTFSAGFISDMTGGRRVQVTIWYLILFIVALITLFAIPNVASSMVYFVVMAILGFAINGPQMMIGLIGAEACDKRVVATATGVLGWISYMGASFSGYPLTIAIKSGGWNAYFGMLVVACVASIACLLPMWRMRTATDSKNR